MCWHGSLLHYSGSPIHQCPAMSRQLQASPATTTAPPSAWGPPDNTEDHVGPFPGGSGGTGLGGRNRARTYFFSHTRQKGCNRRAPLDLPQLAPGGAMNKKGENHVCHVLIVMKAGPQRRQLHLRGSVVPNYYLVGCTHPCPRVDRRTSSGAVAVHTQARVAVPTQHHRHLRDHSPLKRRATLISNLGPYGPGRSKRQPKPRREGTGLPCSRSQPRPFQRNRFLMTPRGPPHLPFLTSTKAFLVTDQAAALRHSEKSRPVCTAWPAAPAGRGNPQTRLFLQVRLAASDTSPKGGLHRDRGTYAGEGPPKASKRSN